MPRTRALLMLRNGLKTATTALVTVASGPPTWSPGAASSSLTRTGVAGAKTTSSAGT